VSNGKRVGDCVACLLELTGMAGRPANVFDWPAIEAGLGLGLPEDYKRLAEIFPQGHFNGLAEFDRPGEDGYSRQDFLGFRALMLEDLRESRAYLRERGRAEAFRYPIYPEPGGLLPWGRDRRVQPLYWLTEAADPADWPVVAVPDQSNFSDWRVYPVSTCQFLIDVVEGRIGADVLGPQLANPKPYQSIVDRDAAEQAAAAAGPPVGLWQGEPEAHGEFPVLAKLIGPPARRSAPRDWANAVQLPGFAPPADYQSFIDTYGPGTFWDITITSLDADGDFDMLQLLTWQAQARAAGKVYWPVYPQPGGLVPWGRTVDGWLVGWVPLGDDPDRWGVAVAAQDQVVYPYAPHLSFSAFLVGLTQPDSYSLRMLGREPWSEGRPLFHPAQPHQH
jgi:hypothetical protein